MLTPNPPSACLPEPIGTPCPVDGRDGARLQRSLPLPIHRRRIFTYRLLVPNAANGDSSQETPVHPRESGLPSLQRSFSNDVLQPFLQRNMRLNSERRLGRHIGCRMSNVPCPRWLVNRPGLNPEQRCELPEDLVETDRLPGRHVEDPSADARCVGRPQI